MPKSTTPPLNGGTVVRAADDVLRRSAGAETVLLDLSTRGVLRPRRRGARLFELLERPHTLDAVVDALYAEYDVARDVLDGGRACAGPRADRPEPRGHRRLTGERFRRPAGLRPTPRLLSAWPLWRRRSRRADATVRTASTTGPCTLLNAARWTTPEGRVEQLPQRHATREIWLTADARIDNRAELLRAARRARPATLVTDADLVLAAYERWGDACLDGWSATSVSQCGTASGASSWSPETTWGCDPSSSPAVRTGWWWHRRSPPSSRHSVSSRRWTRSISPATSP